MTGATGFVGAAIAERLRARGDSIVAVTRDAASARKRLGDAAEWHEADPTSPGDWQKKVAGCDAAINLAGESLAGKRWDARYRQILVDSRIDVTHFLVDAIGAAGKERPRVLLSASGIDYYPFSADVGGDVGDGDDEAAMTETSPPGDSFLARLCRDWEQEAAKARLHDVRVVAMRMGIVLGPSGGALSRLATPFKMFVGGRVGSGRQWVAWVHIDDVVGAFLYALDHDTVSGAVNLLAPGAVQQGAFARALGRALHRPSWLPVPGPMLRLAVGPFAEYILEGRRAAPAALLAAGYPFAHPDLDGALAAIYERRSSS
jgi:uncharacterized protein (TIGR01777 family)